MFHFISGLPRSGSTLLAALLRQNPKFAAGITSPLGPLLAAARAVMSPQQETHGMWSGEQQANVLLGLFYNFYDEMPEDVVFDTNRRWCIDAAALGYLFPDCKIICCVRDPVDIFNSFEHLFRRHPVVGNIYNCNQNMNVYQRVAFLLQPDCVVGYALAALRDAFYGPEKHRLIIIEYKDLATYPQATLRSLHEALELPTFEYDCTALEQIPGAAEFDKSIKATDLHYVRHSVGPVKRDLILPPDLVETIPKPFWR